MKLYLVVASVALTLLAVEARPPSQVKVDASRLSSALLGRDKCTYGPTYWCSSVDNARLCGAVRHCMRHIWKQLPTPAANSMECSFCEFLMQEAKELLKKNSTEEHIHKFLLESCDLIPDTTLRDECKSAVNEYLKKIINLILHNATPAEVCKFIGMCDGYKKLPGNTNLRFQPVSNKASTACVDCVKFLMDIKSIITSRTTAEEFESIVILHVCSKLGPLRSACQELVMTYGPEVMKCLASEVNPQPICQTLGFCKAHSVIDRTLLRAPIKTANYCSNCISFMDDLKKEITKKMSVEELEEFLDVLCDVMGPFSAKCRALVKDFTPYLLQLLANQVDSQVICQELKFCTSLTFVKKRNYIHKNNERGSEESTLLKAKSGPVMEMVAPSEDAAMTGEFCGPCIAIVNEVKVYLNNGTVKAEIAKFITTKVCSQMGFFEKLCSFTMSKTFPWVYDHFIHDMNAHKICYILEICNTTNLSVSSMQPVTEPQDLRCDACTLFLTYFKRIFDGQTFANEMASVLDKAFCGWIPKYREQCKKAMKFAVDYLQDILLGNMQPRLVCELFGVCKNTLPSAFQKHLMNLQAPTKPASFNKCKFCQVSLEILRTILTDPILQKDLTNVFLNEVCPLMKAYSLECKLFVDGIFPVLYKYIAQTLKPNVLCVKFHACNSTSQESATDQSYHKQVAPNSFNKCEFCQVSLEMVKAILSDKVLQKDLSNVFTKEFCPLFGKYSEECKLVVLEFFPVIYKYIDKEFKPHALCVRFHACHSTSKDSATDQSDHKQVAPNSFNKCEFCQVSLEMVKAILSDKVLQKDLRNVFIKELCPLFKKYSGVCNLVVLEFFPVIYKYIDKEFQPKVLCYKFHACNSTSIPRAVIVSSVNGFNKCKFCQVSLEILRSILTDKTLQTDFTNVFLKHVCPLLKSYSKECVIFVDDFMPAIYKIINDELKPNVLCKKFHACNSTATLVPATTLTRETPVRTTETDSGCSVCELALTMIKISLEFNKTEILILHYMEEACSYLPQSLKSEFLAILRIYGKGLIQKIIAHINPKELCRELHLCKSSFFQSQGSSQNGIVCEACKFIVGKYDDILKSNYTMRLLREVMSLLCDLTEPRMRKECKRFITEYAVEILEAIAYEMKPQFVCEDLHLCSTSGSSSSHPRSTTLNKTPSESCEICDYLLHNLFNMLAVGDLGKTVIRDIGWLCDKIMPSKAAECKLLSTDLFKLAVQYLNHLNVHDTCRKLHLCKRVVDVPKVASVDVGVHSIVGCELCEFVMRQLDSLLKEKRTREEIEAALDKVCSFLPSEFTSECESFVKRYTDKIITLLLNGISPRRVCTELHLCSTQKHEQMLKSSAVKTGWECELCKLVMGQIESMFIGKSTEKEIKAALDKVCSLLPSTFASECDKLVNKYADKILIFVLERLTPSFFCTELHLCSSENHKQVLKSSAVKSGLECELCKLVMGQIESMLVGKSTEKEIKAALDKVCSLLPSTFSSECDKFVNKYADKIINLLLKGLAPSSVCIELHLCSIENHKQMLKSSAVKSGLECELCKLVMGKIESMLVKSTEKEIKAALDKVCSLLPSTFSSECDKFVNNYADKIINLLLKGLAPSSVCTELHLCSSENHKQMLKSSAVKSGLECELCKLVMGKIESMLVKSTEKEIKVALDKVCSLLPSTFSSECDKFVNNYADKIINLLLKGLAPSSVCTELHLCSSENNKQMLKSSAVKSGLECELCKLVMGKIESMLVNFTEKEIKVALDKVCSLLPSTFASECDKFVNKYADKIINLLLKGLAPSFVCTELHLCSSENHEQMLKSSAVKSGLECELCKLVMGKIESMLVNFTEKEIKVALDKVCSLLPSTYASECDKFVNKYADKIINLLLKGLTPSFVCTELHLCSSENNKQMLKSSAVKSGLECELCKLVMGKIESMLVNFTEKEIKVALDKVCSLLPSTFASECDKFVNKYADKIINLLLKGLAPSFVCTELHLCSSENHEQMLKSSAVKSGLECELCKLVMGKIESMLVNFTEKEIKVALDKVCSLLPSTYASECDKFVNKYADKIINLLLKGLTPSFVCTELHLCSSENNKQMLKSSAVKSGLECELCELVMGKIESMLVKFTEKEIKVALDEVCSLLPSTYASECDKFVNKYADKIINLLLKGLAPSFVCIELHLCSIENHKQMLKSSAVKSGLECELCKLVMGKIESMLVNFTEKEIKVALDKVCSLLPSTYASECDKFVNKYADKIINLLLKGLTPSFVCTELHLCSSESQEQMLKSSAVKSGLECELCKLVMGKIESMLVKFTEKEIKVALDEVCSLLPSTYASECDKFVNKYADKIINLLLKGLAPSFVCIELHLCSIENHEQVLKSSAVKSGLECELCKLVMGQIESMLVKSKEKEIKAALDKVCSLLPSTFSSECDKFVNKYADRIINLLLKGLAPSSVCTELHLCSSENHKQMLKSSAVKSGLECELCKLVMGQIESMLVNFTEKEIKVALDKVCSLLPSTYASECDKFVNKYADKIINLLLKGLTPSFVCTELHLCSSENNKQMLKSSAVKSGLECELCKLVMGKIESMLVKFTEKEIKAALDKVCSLLPSTFASECDKFVNKYADKIIDLLLKGLAPSFVCTELHLCSSENHKHTPKSSPVNSIVECELCELVMGKIESMIKEKATRKEIKAALDKVCGYLPATYASKCEKFVNNYADEIITLLLNGLSPSRVCTELHLCSSRRQKRASPVKSSVECVLCKFVMGKLDSLLKEKYTEEEIRKGLHLVCTLLPPKYASPCTGYVKRYFDEIITLLLKGLSPTRVCTELHLCSTQSTQHHELELQASSAECILCEYLMSEFEYWLIVNSTEVKKFLDEACHLLPASTRPECERLVNSYYKILLKLLLNFIHKNNICAMLHMCAAPKTPGMGGAAECELCRTGIKLLYTFLKENATIHEIVRGLQMVCDVIPSYSPQCRTFISTYTQYWINALENVEDPTTVCREFGLCPKKTRQLFVFESRIRFPGRK